ncbi:hypothetical protein, partial [Salmonella sp. S146_54837]|uniref:hypothetical protein n=1 Tax=Salmonella sp. S146_54837 TaxID=2665635 RepID=UPI001CA95F96
FIFHVLLFIIDHYNSILFFIQNKKETFCVEKKFERAEKYNATAPWIEGATVLCKSTFSPGTVLCCKDLMVS